VNWGLRLNLELGNVNCVCNCEMVDCGLRLYLELGNVNCGCNCGLWIGIVFRIGIGECELWL
jgi:hypothetical protein